MNPLHDLESRVTLKTLPAECLCACCEKDSTNSAKRSIDATQRGGKGAVWSMRPPASRPFSPPIDRSTTTHAICGLNLRKHSVGDLTKALNVGDVNVPAIRLLDETRFVQSSQRA